MHEHPTDFTLYIRALTHTSYAEENGGQHNERMEFMGDAVLQLAASAMLWEQFPDATEGELSRLRRLVVNNEFLAGLAREIGLGALLRLGRGEEQTGGRQRERNLSGAYEALLCAIYLDQGLPAAQALIEAVIRPRLDTIKEVVNPKLRLHEWVQATYKETPRYTLVSTSGPDHQRSFTMAVWVMGEQVAEGSGSSKKGAASEAAAVAAEKLGLL
ncbi:MAG: ribonuclease III [Myxococcota bacterium]|nr:ribonuclease III [Myxococcota bacterium]